MRTDPIEPPGVNGAPRAALGAEDARRALIAWVETGSDKLLKAGLPNLKTDPIRPIDSRTINIGVWYVDLDRRRFVLSIARPPLFVEYTGCFSRGPDGAWVATGQVTAQT